MHLKDIYSRSSWGARFSPENYKVPKAKGVVVHHSVTATLPANISSVEDEKAQMRKIEEVGHSRFGYTVSYNVVIFPSGRAYEGCPFNKRGQHTGDNNSTVRSICFAGNYETHEPTQAQLDTARNIMAEGRGTLWEKNAFVKGHRDYTSTACPGRNVYKHLPYIASGKANVTPVKNPVPNTPELPRRVTVNVSMPTVDLRDVTPRVKGRGLQLVQTLLVFAGYNIGRAGIDGVGGPDTRKALGEFQVATGTGTNGKADYVVGAKSWRELIGGWQG